MSTYLGTPKRTSGFTLVELLVVIAIIGILASIVVPNVVTFMQKARVAKAVSEVKGAEQALVAALADTRRANFAEFLINDPARPTIGYQILFNPSSGLARPANFTDASTAFDNIRRVQRFYNQFFYEMLRQGRNSDFIRQHVKPEIRQKLGTSYMELANDPWGNQYNFWVGPQRGPSVLRSYRLLPDQDPDDPGFIAYQYDSTAKSNLDAILPGNPRADDSFGYPAPRDLPIYIFSIGPNQFLDSVHFPSHLWTGGSVPISMPNVDFPEFWGGGDDVNNWDSESGWENAPK